MGKSPNPKPLSATARSFAAVVSGPAGHPLGYEPFGPPRSSSSHASSSAASASGPRPAEFSKEEWVTKAERRAAREHDEEVDRLEIAKINTYIDAVSHFHCC